RPLAPPVVPDLEDRPDEDIDADPAGDGQPDKAQKRAPVDRCTHGFSSLRLPVPEEQGHRREALRRDSLSVGDDNGNGKRFLRIDGLVVERARFIHPKYLLSRWTNFASKALRQLSMNAGRLPLNGASFSKYAT